MLDGLSSPLQAMTTLFSSLVNKGYQFIQGKNPPLPRVYRQTAAAWCTQPSGGYNSCSSLQLHAIAYIYINNEDPKAIFPVDSPLHHLVTQEFQEAVDVEICLLKKIYDLSQTSSEIFRDADFNSHFERTKEVLEDIEQAPLPQHVKNKLLVRILSTIAFLCSTILDHVPIRDPPNSILSRQECVQNFLREWRIVVKKQSDLSPLLSKLLQMSDKVDSDQIYDSIRGYQIFLHQFVKVYEEANYNNLCRALKQVGPGNPLWKTLEKNGLVIPSDASDEEIKWIFSLHRTLEFWAYRTQVFWYRPELFWDWPEYAAEYTAGNELHHMIQRAVDCVGPDMPFLKMIEEFGFFVNNKWVIPINGLRDVLEGSVVKRAKSAASEGKPFVTICEEWGLYLKNATYNISGVYQWTANGKWVFEMI